MTVEWTPALRIQVHASRTQPNPAFLVERLQRRSLAYPLDPAACRAKAEAHWASGWGIQRRSIALMRTGFANNPPHWKAPIEAMIARVEAPTVEIPLDVEVEAASVVCGVSALYVAVPYWVTRGGLAFALRALIRCHELQTYGKQHLYLDERGDWMVETRDRSLFEPEGYLDEWTILRALLAEASEPDYAEARAVAEAALERTATGTCWERGMQLLIPFAFPDEPAFHDRGRTTALEIAAHYSKQKKPDHIGSMATSRYLTVAPLEIILEVSAHRSGGVAFDDLLTIIAHRGLATGLQVLEANVDKWISERHRKGWCKLLFALRSPEIVELVARRYPDSKAVTDAVTKFHQPKKRKRNPAAFG